MASVDREKIDDMVRCGRDDSDYCRFTVGLLSGGTEYLQYAGKLKSVGITLKNIIDTSNTSSYYINYIREYLKLNEIELWALCLVTIENIDTLLQKSYTLEHARLLTKAMPKYVQHLSRKRRTSNHTYILTRIISSGAEALDIADKLVKSVGLDGNLSLGYYYVQELKQVKELTDAIIKLTSPVDNIEYIANKAETLSGFRGLIENTEETLSYEYLADIYEDIATQYGIDKDMAGENRNKYILGLIMLGAFESSGELKASWFVRPTTARVGDFRWFKQSKSKKYFDNRVTEIQEQLRSSAGKQYKYLIRLVLGEEAAIGFEAAKWAAVGTWEGEAIKGIYKYTVPQLYVLYNNLKKSKYNEEYQEVEIVLRSKRYVRLGNRKGLALNIITDMRIADMLEPINTYYNELDFLMQCGYDTIGEAMEGLKSCEIYDRLGNILKGMHNPSDRVHGYRYAPLYATITHFVTEEPFLDTHINTEKEEMVHSRYIMLGYDEDWLLHKAEIGQLKNYKTISESEWAKMYAGCTPNDNGGDIGLFIRLYNSGTYSVAMYSIVDKFKQIITSMGFGYLLKYNYDLRNKAYYKIKELGLEAGAIEYS